MGQWKTLLVAILSVLATQNSFVKGQGALQIDPYEDLHGKSIQLTKKPIVDIKQVENVRRHNVIHDDQSLEWRLPREVIPSLYTVKISPVIEAGQEHVGEEWTTPGTVDITVEAQRQTSNIILHSKDTEIHEITVTQGSINIPGVSFQKERYHDYLNISLGAPLERGHTYVISINFTSLISEELNGLYRSSYINPDTKQRVWLATSQMEALHARQMFPCFDEPALKSIFQFTIGRMPKHLALHNTASISNTTRPDGWIDEQFAPTVKMSTYLLAVIISEFKYEEAPADLLPGKTVRTYAPEHYIRDQGGVYAAENAAKVLSYFGTYFDSQYPMTKMDSAAVPDFFFGAMENYGLNIYRESALLVFPGVSLESERWSVTNIIAHELAHQWFGNLVSPAWWTYIWLNEGFATYFAAVGATHTNPEFESERRFLNDAVQRSMEYAADPGYAHPVKIGEVEWAFKGPMDWFDRMVYDQAGSLIRMMDGFLTTPLFQAALRTYLSRLQYSSAQQDDLFRDLNNMAQAGGKLPPNLTIKEIMDTWTLKAGFPLVRVSKAGSNRIYVSQEKYTNNVGAVSAKNFADNELWHIPISIATQDSPNFNPEPEEWLDKNVAMTAWDIDAEKWIILNAGATGYFRVLYDTPLTNLINAQLKANHSEIEGLTRSQLLDDYFSAAYQKYLSVGIALDLTSYLGKETDIVVWNAVLKHLRKPINLFQSSGTRYSKLRNYLLQRVKQALSLTPGFGGDFGERAGMPVIRHQQFLDWACAMEDDDCQAYAVDSVNSWKSTNNNTIPRDLHQILYCSAVAKGGNEIYQFIKQRYNNTETTTVQQTRLRNALGCSIDSGNINELLEGSLAENYFKSDADAAAILERLSMTVIGRSQVVPFIEANAAAIKTRFGNSNPIASVFNTLASYTSTLTELMRLETIVDDIKDVIEDVRPRVNASLTTIKQNILWVEDFGESFDNL